MSMKLNLSWRNQDKCVIGWSPASQDDFQTLWMIQFCRQLISLTLPSSNTDDLLVYRYALEDRLKYDIMCHHKEWDRLKYDIMCHHKEWDRLKYDIMCHHCLEENAHGETRSFSQCVAPGEDLVSIPSCFSTHKTQVFLHKESS